MGTQRPQGEHSLGAFQELQGGQVSAVGAGAGGQASWGSVGSGNALASALSAGRVDCQLSRCRADRWYEAQFARAWSSKPCDPVVYMLVRTLGPQARVGSSAELLVGPPLPFSPGPGGPALQPGGPWGAKIRASENLTYPQAPTATRVEGSKDGRDGGRWQWPWLGRGLLLTLVLSRYCIGVNCLPAPTRVPLQSAPGIKLGSPAAQPPCSPLGKGSPGPVPAVQPRCAPQPIPFPGDPERPGGPRRRGRVSRLPRSAEARSVRGVLSEPRPRLPEDFVQSSARATWGGRGWETRRAP